MESAVAPAKINLSQKLAQIPDYWNPRIIGRYNGNDLRLSKAKGDFVWHRHADTDELFLVISGRLSIEFRDRTEILSEGEIIVVPRGVEHRPSCADECHLLVIDLEGTINTGAILDHGLTRLTLDQL